MRRALILAGVAAVGSVVGFVPSAQGELRVGKNYRLTSDPNGFRAKDMVALAVNPAGPQHIVEVNSNYLTQDCEGTASFDGGETWTTAAPFVNPPPVQGQEPFLAPCRISTHLAESMLQTVAFGSGQNVYATYITPRSTPTGGEQGASTLVVKSTDGGDVGSGRRRHGRGCHGIALLRAPHSDRRAGSGHGQCRPGVRRGA